MAKRLLNEGIGTCFLMLAFLLAGGPVAPLLIGLVYGAWVFVGARLSGAHYNPAISLVVFLQEKLGRDDLPGYAFVQIVGAVFGAVMAGFMQGVIPNFEVQVHTNHVLATLVAEFLGSFALVYAFLHTVHTKQGAGNQYFGLAVGAVLAGLIACFGEVSGAVFNPALAVGLAIGGKLAWGDLWLYLVACPLGASVAGTVWGVQTREG
jgi:aquaporin Z